ncbi:MAG: 50S ribosomal protein L10 [Deltaproteobacteria bacterium]|nr:50S ribosomal protein L10 [Deltaproteobacteria bacterium]
MNRQEKTQQIDELRELFDGTQLAIITRYDGVVVPRMVEFRAELRKNQSGYRVVKNSLARLATADTDLQALHAHFAGPVGVAFTKQDPAATAKIVTAFVKANPKMEIRAGVLAGGTLIDAAGVEALSKLPGKDELRGSLLGALSGVPRNLLGVFTAAQRGLVGVLAARQTQLEGA